jgi:hypothetical protein
MTARIWLRLAETFVPVAIAVTIILAWEADRRDRAQLAARLASAQQTINQVTAQQKDRDAQLTQTLAQLTAQKQSNLSTAQLLQALPQALGLPAPLTLQGQPQKQSNVEAGFGPSPAGTAPIVEPPSGPASAKGNSPPNPHPAANPALPAIDNPLPKSSAPQPAQAADAVIPPADLKPLYDFALDCKACQAKLAAAQADLADEKTKSVALTKERDEAVTAAKGGSALRRIARGAKWFLLGAAAGAVAAKAGR